MYRSNIASVANYRCLQISGRVTYKQTFLAHSCCDNLARTVNLDKRYREAAEPHADGGTVGIDTQQMLSPQKRARGSDDATNEILKVARCAARSRHNPVARIVQGIYMYH